jgi:hypothetical protein
MICQCCGSTRYLDLTSLLDEPEVLCFTCWRFLMLHFVGQHLAADKWVRDSEEG